MKLRARGLYCYTSVYSFQPKVIRAIILRNTPKATKKYLLVLNPSGDQVIYIDGGSRLDVIGIDDYLIVYDLYVRCQNLIQEKKGAFIQKTKRKEGTKLQELDVNLHDRLWVT